MRSCWLFLTIVLASACAAPIESDTESSSSEIGTESLTLRADVEARAQASASEDASDAERERVSLHLGNAYWLARLADYAYWPPTVIQQQLRDLHADVQEFHFFSNACTGAQAFYASTPRGAVLAFRGSDALTQDWIHTNGNSIKVGWGGPGRVHAGFLRQLDSLWHGEACDAGSEGGSLGAFISARHAWEASGARRGSALYVTGHSLGGALATLFLARVQQEGCRGVLARCTRPPSVPISALYTYASPKTGDESFATTVAARARRNTPIFRVVYGDDPVTFFPRNLFPELSDYRHVGYAGLFGESSLQIWIADKVHLRVAEPVLRGPWVFEDHGLPPYIDTLRALARSHSQLP